MKTVGIYAGSFNPFHIGHQYIAEQASSLFDEVIIAQGHKDGKPKPETPRAVEAVGFDRRLLGFRFFQYEGLLTDFAKTFDDDYTYVYIVRGYRSQAELEEQLGFGYWLKKLDPNIRMRCIETHPSLRFVSSSALREIGKYKPEVVAQYLV